MRLVVSLGNAGLFNAVLEKESALENLHHSVPKYSPNDQYKWYMEQRVHEVGFMGEFKVLAAVTSYSTY